MATIDTSPKYLRDALWVGTHIVAAAPAVTKVKHGRKAVPQFVMLGLYPSVNRVYMTTAPDEEFIYLSADFETSAVPVFAAFGPLKE